MSGNTFGRIFTVTSFGESHGRGLGCIIDGCPPGLALSEADIQVEVDRRRSGKSRYTSQRRESDKVCIWSGVFEGKTTGTPIGMTVTNENQRSRDYSDIRDRFRPGHADYTYLQKYGIRDYRGGGRASARETVMRVAAGAIAKKYLSSQGIVIRGYVAQIGDIVAETVDWDEVHKNPFFFPDAHKITALENLIDGLRTAGDSIGALLRVEALNVPVGLGEPVFDRLDAQLAHALMSINAVKGVEIGAGFAAVTQHGSQHRDEMTPQGFLSNNAGGILGGISTGQTIVAQLALKPTSSIVLPGRSIDIHGNKVLISTKGRHDPCVGIRAVPIAEAMTALVIVDQLLLQRAQNSAVECATPIIPGKALNS